jgi:hypothetical protein
MSGGHNALLTVAPRAAAPTTSESETSRLRVIWLSISYPAPPSMIKRAARHTSRTGQDSPYADCAAPRSKSMILTPWRAVRLFVDSTPYSA